MSEKLIAWVFAKHDGLFGRTYTTAIVLWAFMSQVLRDGKEASCQSAVARISSYLGACDQDDVDGTPASIAALEQSSLKQHCMS